MSIGAWMYLPHEYAGSCFLCKTQAYFLSDRECSYMYLFSSSLFFFAQSRWDPVFARADIFFPRYNSSLELDNKTLCAIHIMQLQLECSRLGDFELHRHKAEITGRVINVNNLFRVWKHWESALSIGLLSFRHLTLEMAIRSPCLTFHVKHALKFYHHLCIELAFFIIIFTEIYHLKICFVLLYLFLAVPRNKDFISLNMCSNG